MISSLWRVINPQGLQKNTTCTLLKGVSVCRCNSRAVGFIVSSGITKIKLVINRNKSFWLDSASLCAWQDAASQRNNSIFQSSMWKIHIKLCNSHPGLLKFLPVLWHTINLLAKAECVTSHQDNYYCMSVFNSHVEVCMLKISVSFNSKLEGPVVSCTNRPDLTQWLLLGVPNYSACFVTSPAWRVPVEAPPCLRFLASPAALGGFERGNTIGFSLLFFLHACSTVTWAIYSYWGNTIFLFLVL